MARWWQSVRFAETTRLFAVEMSTCSGVLEFLARRGLLLKTATGHFVLPRPLGEVRPEMTHADVMPAHNPA